MNTALWKSLEDFSFDPPGVALSFSERLRRENGWSASHTAAVITEYRRFLYLCAEAGHPVTPSDAVDQAWHLHLSYTRSYWEELCGEVLGKPLHHGPTRGGSAEVEKFREWYAATLLAYREHFGKEAPARVWPPPEQRFLPSRFERVDRARLFLVPRKAVAAGLVAVVLLGITAGCDSVVNAVDSTSGALLMWIALVLLFLFLAIKYGGRGGKGGSGCGGGFGGCGSGCGGGCGGD